MKSMNIRQAREKDIPSMQRLIQLRIDWMNTEHIHQWNLFDYLNIFDTDYFKERIHCFYIIEEKNELLCFAGLFSNDPYWTNETNYYSIHHFTSHPFYKGYGKILMNYIIDKSIQDGKQCLCLDCLYGNKKLETYYTEYGFRAIKEIHDGDYHGVLMKKLLVESSI